MKGLEVCAFSVDDAFAAEAAGCARLELCSDYDLGGVTPTYEELKRLSPQGQLEDYEGDPSLPQRGLRVPAVVMLRPRGGDFAYNKREKKWMVTTLLSIAKLGFQGVVFGALIKKNGSWRLDKEFCMHLCEIAHSVGLETVLHRAFDEISTPLNAVDEAQECGFDRILTGWGTRNLETLKMLRWHADTIDILPGGGIRPANVQLYRDLGFKEVHSSCRNDLGQLDISQVKHMAEVMKGVVL